MKKFASRLQCTGILLLLWFCAGCKMGRPPRKMLPDGVMTTLGTQGTFDMPFYYTDTLISQQPFFAIALPHPEYDSVVLGLAAAYESIPNTVFSMMHAQGKKGAVIDVRGGRRGASIRSTIIVQTPRQNNSSVTVIFLWDDNSAYRAAAFLDELKQAQGITYSVISTEADVMNKQGCFEKNKPGF